MVNKVNGQPAAKYPTIEIKGRVNEVNGQNAVTDTASTQTGKHFLAGDPETFAYDDDGTYRTTLAAEAKLELAIAISLPKLAMP